MFTEAEVLPGDQTRRAEFALVRMTTGSDSQQSRTTYDWETPTQSHIRKELRRTATAAPRIHQSSIAHAACRLVFALARFDDADR